MKSRETLLFVASGGYGRRLEQYVPALSDKTLSKSLGITYRGKPLVAEQLVQVSEAIDFLSVAVVFTQEKSIQHWQRLVAIGFLPKLKYIYTLIEYDEHASGSDIFKSFAHESGYDPNSYRSTIMSSGDILTSPDIFSGHQSNSENRICLKKVTSPFALKNQKNLQLQVDRNDVITGFREIGQTPDYILGHPIFMSPVVSELVLNMQPGKSKRDLVIDGIANGVDFKLIRPRTLINVNTIEDLRLLSQLESTIKY